MLRRALIFVFLVITPFHWLFAAGTDNLQYSLRTGMVMGTFSGAEAGSFAIASSLEGEVRIGSSPKLAQVVKGTFSMEPDTGQVKYLYSGGGQRYYFFSRFSGLDIKAENYTLRYSPRKQYFVGWDLGLAQVHVRDLTDPISVQATVLEYGAMAGAAYKFSESYGVDIIISAAKGIAVSSVQVDSTIIRLLVGINLY